MQVLEVAGQEILTKDKVALRVNLNAGVPRRRRAGGVREAGEADGLPVQGAAVRPARGGRHPHARRAAGEQGVDRRSVAEHIVHARVGYGLEVEASA